MRPKASLLTRVVALALAGATAGIFLPAAGTPAWAGTTGKIAGRVVDAKGQPLVGASVAVPALKVGAATDADGRYTILNIPAGTYDVRINLLGYAAVTTTGLVVSSDMTARLDVTLKENAVQLTEVVVKSTRPVVDVSKTTSIANVTAAEIAKLPVQELQDVVNLQAGVVDGHFRGGRLGEVQYQVDGVSVNNAYDNKSTLKLDRSLLEEVQVISGTFDAEYGQAQSGVVNAVLKRGGDHFAWNAETFAGGFVYPGDAQKRALGTYDLKPTSIQNYQVGLNGPTPIARTTFLLSARRYVFDDYAYGERRFDPVAPSDSALGGVIRLGDGSRVALGQSREWSGVFKVSSRLLQNIEVTYQGIVNVIDGRPQNWAYHLIPDGRTSLHTYSIVHGMDINHTLSKRSFYNFSVRQNYFDYHEWAYANLYDPRYDSAGAPGGFADYEDGAIIHGVDPTRFTQNTNTLLFKGSYVRQSSVVSQFKAGGEFQLPRVTFGHPGYLLYFSDANGVSTLTRRVDDPPDFPGTRIYFPVLASAFAQDQIEHDDMTIRVGLRFDMFNARSTIPSDLANPANDLPGQPLSHPQATTPKYALSPRLGVSWPTGPKAAAHFAYGHFVQFPSISDIFQNADYAILKGLQADPTQEAKKGVLGNPDIKPERTIQYEAGYKQAISENLGVDLTVFYKDIRDLLGVEFISMYNGAQYARLANFDFGSVLGFTLSFDLRPSGPFGMTLDYTWQNARGNSSDPRETQTRAAAGEDPRPRQIPFNWDQRHTVNLTASISKPEAYTIAAIVKAGSGQPYTPSVTGGFGSGLEANTGRKPSFLVIDLRAEKSLPIGGMPASVFARVFNLLDTRFVNGAVYATTGSPYYSRFPETDRAELNNPTRYYAPRRIEIGLNLASGKGRTP